MTFNCTGPDNAHRNVGWVKIKNAWVPAITVCDQNLYSYVPEVDVVPTVATNEIHVYGSDIQLDSTVLEQGSSNITEYGIVYSTSDPPTVEDTKVVVGTGPFLGDFTGSHNFNSGFGTTFYFRPFATNATGTGYGTTLSGTPFVCLIEGTMVTLANGHQKPIQDIRYNDDLLVWNFDQAKFDTAKPVWIVKPFEMDAYNLIRFSDGSELGTIAGVTGHSIFNSQKGQFTHLNAPETPEGTKTFNQNKKLASLVDVTRIAKRVRFYNIMTHTHINLFTNGILTSSVLNNLYPIKNMKFIKDKRALRKNEFGASNEMFEGLRLAEQPYDSAYLKHRMTIMAQSQL